MSPLVDIIGVGGHLRADSLYPARFVRQGDRVDVDDRTRNRLVSSGIAVDVAPAEEDVAAEQAVTADPGGAAPVEAAAGDDLDGKSVAELKQLVKERGLTVGQARTKPALLKLLRDAVPADGQADNGPADTTPVADLDAPLGDDEAELPEDEVDLSALTDGQLRKLAAEEDVELPADVTRGRAIELIGAADDEDGDDDGDA